jgi:dolichyl-phosphate beta-glucosyltransferase
VVGTTYSIIIPAFNEGARLEATLTRVLHYIRVQGWDAEVVVVNDGSGDNTAVVTQHFAENHPNLRLLNNPGNRGKGYSVRNGVLNARGQMLLFCDADLSSPIEESANLFEALERGADIAIGSRWLQVQTQIKRQPLYRQAMGRIFNLVIRVMLGLPFKDTQCGFKAFKRSAAGAIFPLQTVEGWAFDAELLFLARKHNLRVEEVPVLWADDSRTRIHPLRDGANMLIETLTIRWNDLTGVYDCPAAQKLSENDRSFSL